MRAATFFAAFLDSIFPPRPSEILVRNIELQNAAKYLLPTLFETLRQEKIISLLPYHEEEIRALILETKFHGNQKATRLLGALLADFLTEYISEETELSTTSYVVVPIPLSKKRRHSRGYNQSEAVCKAALKILGDISLAPELLTRTRDTVPQTSLGAYKRKNNIRGAFSALPTDSRYTYILVDDVITTGATLSEAIHTLKKTGAENVLGLALAH